MTTDNQVHLAGRVSALLEPRTLPSGDEVITLRLVVQRSAAARKRSKQTVDTFDCDAWTADLRRKVTRLAVGDRITITGRLRRQFSRGPAGATSRVTVDLTSVASTP